MMSKQKKYLALSVESLEELIKVAKRNRHGCAVIHLEAAGKRWPGQLSYTDDFRRLAWANASGFDSYKEYQEASVEEVNRRRDGLKEPKADEKDLESLLWSIRENLLGHWAGDPMLIDSISDSAPSYVKQIVEEIDSKTV